MQYKNIVHTTSYQKDGQEKKKYTNVGTLFIYDDGGMSIKLDSIPVNFDGKLAVYDRDENKQRPSQQTSQYAQQPAPIGQPAPVSSVPPVAISEGDIPFAPMKIV